MKHFKLTKDYSERIIAKFDLPDDTEVKENTVRFTRENVTAYKSMVLILKYLEVPITHGERVGHYAYAIQVAASPCDNEAYFFHDGVMIQCGEKESVRQHELYVEHTVTTWRYLEV